ncbi:uncharacterized protein LOC143432964 isoform X2 [Xylocopa sonorina]|uniref:uncharacterized protein LOC143432964 isoform X2 n=1 Tax=Xylocopa sonorina TaxID=1818115 RepID=UPI00403B0ECD
MADYWKSQGRKFCDFCKCWIADNKPSIDFHEGGKKHKENVSKRLKEIHKNSAKQAKQNKKIEDDIKRMENAAMAAYLKDVENNTRDMTAERIIKNKITRLETKDLNSNGLVAATPEAAARFKGGELSKQLSQEIDPCDPNQPRNGTTSQQARFQQKHENKTQGKNKSGKGKGKGRKTFEDERPSKPVRKLWYEAVSPEGYTYYWHIETNESVWNPPEEGYMTFAEQEEEAKEQAIQEELLKQLENEDAIANAEIREEKRANAEREKLKGFRRISNAQSSDSRSDEKAEIVTDDRTEVSYRKDYSIPLTSHPYGPWQTVRKTEARSVDLQLPQQKQLQLPVFEKAEPPPSLLQKTFKEKMITRLDMGGSDEDEQPTTFKKRKIGEKSVRKRITDD